MYLSLSQECTTWNSLSGAGLQWATATDWRTVMLFQNQLRASRQFEGLGLQSSCSRTTLFLPQVITIRLPFYDFDGVGALRHVMCAELSRLYAVDECYVSKYTQLAGDRLVDLYFCVVLLCRLLTVGCHSAITGGTSHYIWPIGSC